jgi:hypothetical protein
MMTSRHGSISIAIIVLLAMALGACSSAPPLYQASTPREEIVKPAGPAVSVYVLPRLGLFDDLLYTNREDYVKRLGKNKLVLDYAAPQENWVAVFPKPTRSSDCAESYTTPYTLCGHLRERVVVLRATGFPGATGCSWTIDDKDIKTELCQMQVPGLPNTRMVARVKIHLPDGDRDVAFEIPADRLIVVMGDSYASGEGNPDAQASERRVVASTNGPPIQNDNNAVWMSERCHRSMWAGPMRAGLKMAQSTERLEGDVKLLHRGGVTIISTACSGAELAHLLFDGSGYEGRTTFGQMKNGHQDLENYENLPLFKSATAEHWRRLKPQLQDVIDLLDTGSPAVPEALLLSIGGNNIGFGDIVVGFVTDKGMPKDATRKKHAASIEQLSREFPKLFQQIEDKLRPENVYLMAYPDPTRLAAPASAGAEPKYCNCAAGSFIGIPTADKKGYLCLDEAENKYASNDILLKLNDQLATVAARYGWYFVHGLEREPFLAGASAAPRALPQFDTHAWCAATDQRWLRTYADSVSLQESIPGNPILSTGAMHPNANGHEAYMGILHDAMAVRGKAPSFEIAPSALSADGKTLYVARSARLSWADGEIPQPKDQAGYSRTFYPEVSVFSAAYGNRTLCPGKRADTAYASTPGVCSLNYLERTLSINLATLPEAEQFDLRLMVRDGTLKRLTTQTQQKLAIDASPPSFDCYVRQGATQLRCDDPAVNTTELAGAPELLLVARDDKSGFQRWNCEGDACPPEQENLGEMRWSLTAGALAVPGVKVRPADRVGNLAAAAASPFEKIVSLRIAPPAIQVGDAGGASVPANSVAESADNR